MEDVVQWLGEQLDEDERIARAATEGPWSVDDESFAESIRAANGTDVVAGGRWGGEAPVFEATEDALHIVRHDPPRVLREIDAKRKLLALHEPHQQPAQGGNADDRSTWMTCCSMCQASMVQEGDWPCESLRLLALPYVDRPGYHAEWRP